jgi:nucleotide-binding universal stress UspA family protein
MSATTERAERLAEPPVWLGAIFDRIVCGVDGTESSRVAVAQAVRLLAARRVLELVTVVEETPVPWSGLFAPSDVERQYEEAQRALHVGHDQCPRARSMVLFGDPGPELVSAAREIGATLAVVGAPDSGRLGGFVLGGAGTYVLHNAPCSVLIAREPAEENAWPRSIVVGHDGSPAAVEATAVAKELAFRFRAALRIVVATGGDPVHVDSLPSEDELDWSSSRPVAALEAASHEADLLVVGSRGLRGPRALGSVSEKIGHLAHCSVLVVREPPEPSGADGAVADAVPDDEC